MSFLSIIIPAHNEEKTIIRTIYSFISQDYSSYEIVVVDDGSIDSTSNVVIDFYRLKDNSIYYGFTYSEHKRVEKVYDGIYKNVHLYLLNKENGGKADALNAGIHFCHGKYFLNADADCVVGFNATTNLVHILEVNPNIVAIGGMVSSKNGIDNYIVENNNYLKNILQSYQELEYHISFNVFRPIFNKMRSTMLISGALGLYRKDLVVKLGGYSSYTVGEDMELVMRIRRYIDHSKNKYDIEYTKEVVCYTELPFKISDLIKQRIRWTVGLSEVLYKYKSIPIDSTYSINEKITFWYYVLFEKFSPHIEFLVLSIWLFCNRPKYLLVYIILDVVIQLSLLFISSYKKLINTIKSSKNKYKTIIRLIFLILSFISIYHFVHSFVRLISVPYYRLKKHRSKNKSYSWNSPTRM